MHETLQAYRCSPKCSSLSQSLSALYIARNRALGNFTAVQCSADHPVLSLKLGALLAIQWPRRSPSPFYPLDALLVVRSSAFTQRSHRCSVSLQDAEKPLSAE